MGKTLAAHLNTITIKVNGDDIDVTGAWGTES
jgi:hypothetical protein